MTPHPTLEPWTTKSGAGTTGEFQAEEQKRALQAGLQEIPTSWKGSMVRWGRREGGGRDGGGGGRKEGVYWGCWAYSKLGLSGSEVHVTFLRGFRLIRNWEICSCKNLGF